MRRREFIGALGGAMVWPLAARAQQGIRRVGVLSNFAETDPEAARRLSAFAQSLKELGWVEGRNLQIDYRYGSGDAERYRKFASELLALAPDVILSGGAATGSVQSATRTVPIVFVSVTDPVAAGYVASLARPGGNITGFALAEYSAAGKWFQLLREIAPQISRVMLLRDPSFASGIGQVGAIQSLASPLGVELKLADTRVPDEFGPVITEFARKANGGLIVLTGTPAIVHRSQIIALAASNRLPAIYPQRYFVSDGGLISYGTDSTDSFRRAAGYVDRILRGEKPADLPVQQAIKFEIAINLRTAKALDLAVPPALLARADEVIE
jgi:putative ABC transport system substrate-binding protein